MKYFDEETVKRLLENNIYHTLEDCPFIEIPDKHGRLVDADLLKLVHCKDCKDNCFYCDSAYVIEMIDEAPTVLKASSEIIGNSNPFPSPLANDQIWKDYIESHDAKE